MCLGFTQPHFSARFGFSVTILRNREYDKAVGFVAQREESALIKCLSWHSGVGLVVNHGAATGVTRLSESMISFTRLSAAAIKGI
jgi:hypothetical protein